MSARVVLEAEGLYRAYRARGLQLRRRPRVLAVAGVSLCVARGEALAVAGESGAGKSTLARLLLALERPDAGAVSFDGHPISHMSAAAVRPLRRRFQAVFQDPEASLNPYLRISTIVAEPLLAHGLGSAAERRLRVAELLHMVGLPPDAGDRRPEAFSGGERQRIAIARALAPGPELLVLDEPVSSLDVSVQSRILALLDALRRQLGLTMVMVSHDLAVVRQLCNRVAIMLGGVIVEQGPSEVVLSRPAHPYTRALLGSVPRPDPDWQPPAPAPCTGLALTADACPHAGRCLLAEPRCLHKPPVHDVGEEHTVACWTPLPRPPAHQE